MEPCELCALEGAVAAAFVPPRLRALAVAQVVVAGHRWRFELLVERAAAAAVLGALVRLEGDGYAWATSPCCA